MKIFQALLYTKHFQFECFGADEKIAREDLVVGLIIHAHQYGIATDWYDPEEIQIREIELGAAYRDQEQIRSQRA